MSTLDFYKKLFSLYDKTKDVCILFDSKGMVLDMNNEAFNIILYPRKQIVGSSIYNIVPVDDRPETKKIFKKILKGSTYSGNIKLIDRHNRIIYTEAVLGSDVSDTERFYYLIAKNQSKVIREQEKFKKLFSTNPMPTSITSLENGKIVDVNDAYLRLIGYSYDEAIGKTTIDLKLYSPEVRKHIAGILKKGIKKGDSYPLEITTKNNETRNVVFYPEIIDLEGEKYFLTVYIDQTETQLQEQQLEKSMWRLNITSKASSIASSMMSADEKIKSILNLVSDSADICHILIYDLLEKRYTYGDSSKTKSIKKGVEFTENDIRILTSSLGRDGSQYEKSVKGLSTNLNKILNPFEDTTFVLSPINSNGNLIAILIANKCDENTSWGVDEVNLIFTLADTLSNVYQQNHEASIIRQKAEENEMSRNAILNVLEDVEEEKIKSEKLANDLLKFELAVSQASDHIAILDNQGSIIYANTGVKEITGYEFLEIIGKTPDQLWGASMPKGFHKKLWQSIAESKKTYKGEVNNIRKNGQAYIAEATISPVLNEKSEVVFYVEVERDITKIKEIDKMKNEFVSIASHQLRTPLSTMKWYLEMLLAGDAGKLTPPQMDFVQNLNTSNERMIDLVNALLNISRIESGRIIIEPQRTKVADMIEGVVNDVSEKAKEKNIKIEISVVKGIPLVNLDIRLIRNALMNLITNSIKYSPKKTKIIVSANKVIGKDEVIFKVKDQGYGILESDKDKVFSKFYRGKNIVKYDTNGNGIGLYLVKAVINSSGGQVWFDSKVNKGTTFYFTLPIKGVPKKEGEVTLED